MSINIWVLGALLGVILGVLLPLAIVLPAARRRQHAIASGELQLQEKTNTIAILALVFAFLGALIGIVLGHIALAQIRRTHERGWGMAVAALWIGYVAIGVPIVVFLISVLTPIRVTI